MPRLMSVPTRRGRSGTHRRRDERGVGGVSFLITIATILFLFTTLVQYGIWLHANRVAEAAAREGAVAAARFDGTAATGRSTAADYLDTSGAVAIRGSTVTVSRSPTEAQVSVRVRIASLMPFLDTAAATATTPVERFVP